MPKFVLSSAQIVVDELAAKSVVHYDGIDLLVGDAITTCDSCFAHVRPNAGDHDGMSRDL